MKIEMKTPKLPNLHLVNYIHQEWGGGVKLLISMCLTSGPSAADKSDNQPGVSVPASGMQVEQMEAFQ